MAIIILKALLNPSGTKEKTSCCSLTLFCSRDGERSERSLHWERKGMYIRPSLGAFYIHQSCVKWLSLCLQEVLIMHSLSTLYFPDWNMCNALL